MRRAWAGQAGLRWVAGWAGPEASLSHKAAKPWVGWAAGLRCWLRLVLGRVAGWARPVSYTLGPEAGWQVAGWAGPEASRRHVRHASRRAEGLGLRLVSGWHTLRPVSDCRHVRQT